MVPKLIAVNAVLVLPLPLLEARVDQEVHTTPALERDSVQCASCGAELTGELCPQCGRKVGEIGPDLSPTLAYDASDEYDSMAHVQAEVQRRHLLTQLAALHLNGRRHRLGEYLIGNLDERGYLTASLDEAAAKFRLSVIAVENVLALIHKFDPVGVGARNIVECLLLQLAELDQSPVKLLAQRIVEEHLPELGRGQSAKVAEKLEVAPQDARDAHEYIKENLYPYPADRYDVTRFGRGRLRPTEVARPDVMVVPGERGYTAEVIGSQTMGLRINDLYLSFSNDLRRAPHAKDHIRDHVARAKLFIETVKRRSLTLRSIASAIVETQQEYFQRGVGHLKPLTLADIATQLGISESTVSRALEGKYVQLPSGRVVSFDLFFDGSLPIKERIRQILAVEDPSNPLTGHSIAIALRREGIRIARRTAAKYREEMGVSPSVARRAKAVHGDEAMPLRRGALGYA